MTASRQIQRLSMALLLAASTASGIAVAAEGVSCSGAPLPGVGGKKIKAWKLADGGIAAFSGMNINIDGYGKAYHPRNREAGAVLHLCVGARIWLPDGSSYEGSDPASNCTGKFMTDMAKIAAAGWMNPSVGAVEWYGVAAEGAVKVAGRTIRGVKPLLQKDGSGFYVSPTSLVDKHVTDIADQHRYPNPLRVPSAVLPRSVAQQGISLGSFGVAIHTKTQKAVPFVVGDGGPKIGEGSPALARQVSGMPMSDEITLKNRFAGQVDKPEVLWVFFGGEARPYDHQDEGKVAVNAQAAFAQWGGEARLAQCIQSVPRP
jgi:hypothetical protein